MDKNFETNKELLERLIHRTEDVEFATNNAQQGITVSFYKRLMSSAKAILSLTGDAYNGCILTSHMLEVLIQLTWLLDKKERIKQYIDFGVVEQLEGLHLHPEKKGQILNIIKEKNIQRLLQKKFLEKKITDKILLESENYYKFWYIFKQNIFNTFAVCGSILREFNCSFYDTLFISQQVSNGYHSFPYITGSVVQTR